MKSLNSNFRYNAPSFSCHITLCYHALVKVTDYNYALPEERIAQYPPEERGKSRLLVLQKDSGAIEHRAYNYFANYLNPGDVVVLNNTKVIKARIRAINGQGQTRELLLLEDHHTLDPFVRKALYRGKVRTGEKLLAGQTQMIIEEIFPGGVVKISSKTPLLDIAEHEGSVPLPPYMHREATKDDIRRYQTVFAKAPGSVAAPTASLNFTEELRQSLQNKGVRIAELTLHVGLGTFLPIREDDIEKHDMHSEYFEIPKFAVQTIQKVKNNRGKIVAIGTTVSRALEFAATKILQETPRDISGEADIFIYPGYEFKVVDSLLTNFHAPKSTVLMMAAAFAGWENLQHAYNEAIKQRYNFLSYGDSMLII